MKSPPWVMTVHAAFIAELYCFGFNPIASGIPMRKSIPDTMVMAVKRSIVLFLFFLLAN